MATTSGLKFKLLDDVESIDYAIPPFRILELKVEIAKTGKIAKLDDPIGKITLTQDQQKVTIDSGDEAEKLLKLSQTVKELDPDIIVTHGGDSYLFTYLLQRVTANDVQDKFILSRDEVPFAPKARCFVPILRVEVGW